MGRRRPSNTNGIHTPTLCISDEEWRYVFDRLGIAGRQADIVKLLVSGAQDKQIAQQLRIRHPTLRTHLGLMFSRTNVADRVQLVLLVFAHLRARQN